MLRYMTAGESHGKGLAGILEGIPAGLALSNADIDRDLIRRQKGYGRGGRMGIESDRADILSGVRWGQTTGSPICLLIENRDWQNWSSGMSPLESDKNTIESVTRPRPGHADLAGAIKYGQRDIRNILERSSARETAMRVALGAIAKQFLRSFGVRIGSYVLQVGGVRIDGAGVGVETKDLLELFETAEQSDLRCPDESAAQEMKSQIDRAKAEGNSLGGVFEVFAVGLPVGLGSHTQWDRRLDGRIGGALMGIQAIKGVEIGSGFGMAGRPGSEVMDEILFSEARGIYRATNHAGGIEGGMTNGMPLIVRSAMKPIPTQARPLKSVDLVTKEEREAAYERSDVCAVPAAGVIGEAMVALVLADVMLEKFGGDHVRETRRNFEAYVASISDIA